jgi:hypothetical protein
MLGVGVPMGYPTVHRMKKMAAELQGEGLQKPGPSVESVEIPMPTSAAGHVTFSCRLWRPES